MGESYYHPIAVQCKLGLGSCSLHVGGHIVEIIRRIVLIGHVPQKVQGLPMGALWKDRVGYWSTGLSFRGFSEDAGFHHTGTHHSIPIFFKTSKISNGADSQKKLPVQRDPIFQNICGKKMKLRGRQYWLKSW